MKLSKSERKSIEVWAKQTVGNDRGNTWLHFRPSIMNEGKYRPKQERRSAKNICRQYV